MRHPTQRAIVESVRALTTDVHEMTIRPLERPVRFRPGQWLAVHLPIGSRPPLIRAYSMATPENDAGLLTLCFDHVPGGAGSSYLFDRAVGEEIVVDGIYGSFRLPEEPDRDLVFVARFTGIVPFHCMLQDLAARRFRREILVVHGAPRTDEFVYGDEILAMSSTALRLRYVPVLLADEPGWLGESGREIEVAARLLGERRDFHPFACGVRTLTEPARHFFQALGFDRKAIRIEHYD
jgi:ferredoxin-NADP reductase